ncbi:N-acyl-D-glucosamine 2-epimerase [Hymenobacter sp. RP-2-7]|uniref:Cellobiose 2-epimerase n=1 Tax=Hymenobacter polaris TaxID=2682546 RepID=A0A7Y0AI95_9BACT|nr:AGE family epimerase/isomerase [Hymenobacter polaris]NML67886.1 N-acyl-D-glucosamine 2-epimerase [Hymenobacter polaris]
MLQAADFEQELANILRYWATHVPDPKHGGFYGQLDNDNQPNPLAPKGSVLHARILWTFAAAYGHTRDPAHLTLARRAYDYLTTHFLDPAHGGVYWTVDYLGQPLDTKKQLYALAFSLYALAEYHRASGEAAALGHAQALFDTIEARSFDAERGGYFEAFGRDWQPLAEVRLSAKDADAPKTMNTHLHILEAYATLYQVWPDPRLRRQLKALLLDFADHFLDARSHHLTLFFDASWQPQPDVISFGHDVEAAWLLFEAAQTLAEPGLVRHFRQVAVQLARAAAEGLAPDGSLRYELAPGGHYDADRHWWVQAEAIVGFYNAYQVSGDPHFRDLSAGAWRFIQQHLLDRARGEWYWGVRPDYSPMPGQDKAGLWKCPYHNGRACLEMLRRLAPPLAPPLRGRGA